MPFWRRSRAANDGGRAGAEAHSPLAEIDRSTPHTYRFWLSDAEDRARAVAALTHRERIPLTFDVVDEPDGRVRVDVAASGNGRAQSVMSVLYGMRKADVKVDGFEATDLVDDLTEPDLVTLVRARQQAPQPHDIDARLERLAGLRSLEACLTRYAPVPIDGRPYAGAVHAIAFNTPGSEDRVVRVAADVAARMRPNDPGYDASGLLSAAQHRGDLCAIAGMPFNPPEDVLLTLVAQPGQIGRTSVVLLGLLSRPLSPAAVTTLCRMAGLDADSHAEEALMALRSAPPTPEVREAAEAAMSSPSNEMRWRGLWLLANHWGTDARPAWKAGLESRSVAVRDVAEQLLATHGGAEDIEDAALRLAKIIRAKRGVTYSPPRGSELIDFLVRYRDVPRAEAALAELAARWDRFPDPDLATWIREHHPWIETPGLGGGAGDVVALDEIDVGPETPIIPEAPDIARIEEGFGLQWDESSAHSDARDRLEIILEADPVVEILESDREWMAVEVDHPDPERYLREAWDRAIAEAEAEA